MPPLAKLKSSLWKLSKYKKVVTCSRLLVKDLEQHPGTWLKLIAETLSKSLTQIFWGTQIHCWMLLTQNAQNWKLCLKSLECRLGTSLCQKHWAKAILSKLVIYSNLHNSTGKKLERQGYLSWWLRTSLWQRDRTQIASDWARGGVSKTHQRLARTTPSGLPVILCQFRSSLLWKQWFAKNLTLLWRRFFVYVKNWQIFQN